MQIQVTAGTETTPGMDVEIELPAHYAGQVDKILSAAAEDLLELAAECAGKIPVALGLKQLPK